MFLGEFEHTIDDKGRLTIPAKFRAELAKGVVVTRGLDRCLFVYPLEEWQKLAGKVSQLPITHPNARMFSRLIFSGAADLSPDRQGRVLLPPQLREYAGLDGEAVVIGVSTRLEIWSKPTWTKVRREVEEEGGMLAEHLKDLGI